MGVGTVLESILIHLDCSFQVLLDHCSLFLFHIIWNSQSENILFGILSVIEEKSDPTPNPDCGDIRGFDLNKQLGVDSWDLVRDPPPLPLWGLILRILLGDVKFLDHHISV